MADAWWHGRRVAIVGSAEPHLIEATVDDLRVHGAKIRRLDEPDMSDFARRGVVVCFARPAAGPRFADLDEAGLAVALDEAMLRPLAWLRIAVRAMASAEGGTIVVVGSVDAWHAYEGRSVASIAMGGLLGLIRSIAVEASAQGVRANLVAAGPIEGPDGRSGQGSERLDRTYLRSPMHRLGRPGEIAAAIRFVAGPDSGFMTGQTLRVDGGWGSLNQAPEGMRFP